MHNEYIPVKGVGRALLDLSIPSYKHLYIEHVIFDYNGTLAVNGLLPARIKEKLKQLTSTVNVVILTADTYGNVNKQLLNTGLKVQIISPENGKQAKAAIIRELGPSGCIAVGNGNNDALMLRLAALGICIIGQEGCAAAALTNSDIVFAGIDDCLDALLTPRRLIATLRG